MVNIMKHLVQMEFKHKRPQKQGTTMDYYIRGRHCYISRYKASDWQLEMKQAKYSYSVWNGEGYFIYDTDDLEKAIEVMAIYDDYRDGVIWTNLASIKEE